MITSIFTIIGLILIVIGLVEVIKMITIFFLRTKGEDNTMIIVPISGHNEEAEFLLRSAAAKVRWIDGFKDKRVICMDCGMDDETRDICKRVVESYNFMEFKTENEIKTMLENN